MDTSEGFAKILILDDDSSVRGLLKDILDPYFDVVLYGDGLNALAWLGSGNVPDLILVDLHMPYVGGIELLQTLKKSINFQRIPVIVLSVYKDEETIEDCLAQGARQYISKPFNPEYLKDTILHTLSNTG